MKKRFISELAILVLTIMASSQLSFARSGDGWSSSGGGEYIIDQNNPWFLGKESVKYCIDHGGEENFSINLELAKIETAAAIQQLTDQIKRLNAYRSDFFYDDISTVLRNGNFVQYCGLELDGERWNDFGCKSPSDFDKEDLTYLSDNYVFVDNCAEADLEIILGNTSNPKIKELIHSIGAIKFEFLAGIAMRTEYSHKTLRGKGFIYIAADKGPLQYRGARNITFKNNTIWDSYYKYKKIESMPQAFNGSFYIEPTITRPKLNELIVGNLQSVLTHELGHVFGVSHQKNSSIMNVNYPAEIIKYGISFKPNYLRDSEIFTRGVYENSFDKTQTYPWRYNYIKRDHAEELQKKSKTLYNFLYNQPGLDPSNSDTNVIFSFKEIPYRRSDDTNEKSILTIYTIDSKTGKYIKVKDYKYSVIRPCELPKEKDNISIRIFQNESNGGWQYDEAKKEWSESTQTRYETISNLTMLSLSEYYQCGLIEIKSALKNKTIHFKLKSGYFSPTQLQLTDVENSHIETLGVDTGQSYNGFVDLVGKIPLNYVNMY